MRREEVLIWWGDVVDSGVWMYRDKLGKWDNKGEVREHWMKGCIVSRRVINEKVCFKKVGDIFGLYIYYLELI